jgi:tetratricopeptide (TPR) repeat protein
MTKSIFIILIFTVNLVFAQNNNEYLFGEWVKVKSRMVDGSKIISEPFLTSKFYRWQIFNKKLCTSPDPVNSNYNSCIDFELENNLIKTSSVSGYEIIKLTTDTLVVVEKIDDLKDKDKTQKLWFVKSSIIKEQYKNLFKNDSILIANENFTPKLNKNFILDINKNFSSMNNFPNFVLIGNLNFIPEQRKLIFEIDNINEKNNIKNKKAIAFVKSVVENSYNNWDLNDFKNFKKIYMPIIFKSEYYHFDGGSFKGASFYFFIKDIDDIKKIYGIKMEDLKLSGELYLKGLKSYENKKYDKAINFFEKSYEVDNRKVDALYNIASIYALLNDKLNLCKYLEKLKDLEQTEGIKLYNENCLN